MRDETVSALEDLANDVVRELMRLEPNRPVDLDPSPLLTRLRYESKAFVFEAAAGTDHIFLQVTPGGPQISMLPNETGVNLAVRYIRTWTRLANDWP